MPVEKAANAMVQDRRNGRRDVRQRRARATVNPTDTTVPSIASQAAARTGALSLPDARALPYPRYAASSARRTGQSAGARPQLPVVRQGLGEDLRGQRATHHRADALDVAHGVGLPARQ